MQYNEEEKHTEEQDLEILEYKVGSPENHARLDIFVAAHSPEWISRTMIKKSIQDGKVTVNEQPKKASFKVKTGDIVCVEVPAPKVTEVLPENIPLDIIYEDKDIIVINKPPDMIVHPVINQSSGTLVNALMYHYKSINSVGDSNRPGIVHRLDKDTSGVIIVAKNDLALSSLSRQFHDRLNKKQYITILHGIPKKLSGKIDKPIARNPRNRIKMAVDYSGKDALTIYETLKTFGKTASLVSVTIKTGRTHQIRVHFKSLNTPVFGDQVYGYPEQDIGFGAKRQMLHAFKLGIFHPRTEKWMQFVAKLPDDFKKTLINLSDIDK